MRKSHSNLNPDLGPNPDSSVTLPMQLANRDRARIPNRSLVRTQIIRADPDPGLGTEKCSIRYLCEYAPTSTYLEIEFGCPNPAALSTLPMLFADLDKSRIRKIFSPLSRLLRSKTIFDGPDPYKNSIWMVRIRDSVPSLNTLWQVYIQYPNPILYPFLNRLSTTGRGRYLSPTERASWSHRSFF